jgi:hypothetical protein
MTDHHSYFQSLISRLLSGELARTDAASEVSGSIGIDDIAGGRESLITNCEWALRHAALPEFGTSQREFAYLLACLRGEQTFSESGRDAAIRAQGATDEA